MVNMYTLIAFGMTILGTMIDPYSAVSAGALLAAYYGVKEQEEKSTPFFVMTIITVLVSVIKLVYTYMYFAIGVAFYIL